MWLALSQVGGMISQQEKELIMSLVGTVILYPPADDGSGAMPRYVEPSIVGLRDLLLEVGAEIAETAARRRNRGQLPLRARIQRRRRCRYQSRPVRRFRSKGYRVCSTGRRSSPRQCSEYRLER